MKRSTLGLDDYVGHWLRRAHHSTASTLSRQIKKFDLTPAQLATLVRVRELGQVSQNELGRRVAMEPANIHKIVNRLLNRRLILARKDPADTRKTLLRLSKKGETLVEQVEPLHWRATKETMSVLNPTERRELLRLLRRLCETD